jgi:prepilin-type N-terminal cleavage/methylation domain-containing protein
MARRRNKGQAMGKNRRQFPIAARRPAFTLIELLTVVAIIAVITAIAVPAIKALGKSNDLIQAENLVRAMLSQARSIAISQHRMAGVAFYEEDVAYARGGAAHGKNTTAMAVFVELYDQSTTPAGYTGFDYFGGTRQYLPDGIRLAALSDDPNPVANGVEGNVVAEDASGKSRIILFDANGGLVLRNDIWDPFMPPTFQGPYSSYPGFFLYSKAEYDQVLPANRITWLKRNSTAVIVNGNTGGLVRWK